MRQVLVVISLVISWILMSCSEESSSGIVGEDWVAGNTKLFYIDTLTVTAATFKTDSLSVSNPERLLIGAYTDPLLGVVHSQSYLQFSNDLYDLDNTATYDSIVMILKYDDYIYNDTLASQTFHMYRLLEDLDKDDGEFYNTSTYEYDRTPIGSLNFYPKPMKTDSISIPMAYDFGMELFDQIFENDINDGEDFIAAFKGLLIDAETTNTCVLGFTTDSYIRMYYTIATETDDGLNYLDFPVNSIFSFNKIVNRFTSYPLTLLNTSNTPVVTTEFEHMSLIQSGSGIYTKIDLPFLEDLYDIHGTGILVDANLKLSLKQQSSNASLHTRDSLSAYIIDKNYNYVDDLYPYYGSQDVAYGVISATSDEFGITTYRLPIKYFLDMKLEMYKGEELSLAIYAADFINSVDRYVWNDASTSDDLKLNVELIYAVYDE